MTSPEVQPEEVVLADLAQPSKETPSTEEKKSDESAAQQKPATLADTPSQGLPSPPKVTATPAEPSRKAADESASLLEETPKATSPTKEQEEVAPEVSEKQPSATLDPAPSQLSEALPEKPADPAPPKSSQATPPKPTSSKTSKSAKPSPASTSKQTDKRDAKSKTPNSKQPIPIKAEKKSVEKPIKDSSDKNSIKKSAPKIEQPARDKPKSVLKKPDVRKSADLQPAKKSPAQTGSGISLKKNSRNPKPIEKACFKLEKLMQDRVRKNKRNTWKRLKLKQFRIDKLIDLRDHELKLACTCFAAALQHIKAARAFRSLRDKGLPDYEQTVIKLDTTRRDAACRKKRVQGLVRRHSGNPHLNKLFCCALKMEDFYSQRVRDRQLALLTKMKRVMEMKKFGKNAVKDLVARLELFTLSRVIKGFRSIKEFDRIIKEERMIKGLDIYAYFISQKLVRPTLEKWNYWIKNSRKKGVAFREILTFMNKKLAKVTKAAFKGVLEASQCPSKRPSRPKSILEPRAAEELPKRSLTPKNKDMPLPSSLKTDKPNKIHKSKETAHLAEPKKLFGTFGKPREPLEPRQPAEKADSGKSSKSKSPKPPAKKPEHPSPRTHAALDKEEIKKVEQKVAKLILASPRDPEPDQRDSKIRVEFKPIPQPEPQPAIDPQPEADKSCHVRTESVAPSSLGESTSEGRQVVVRLKLTPDLVQRINRRYSEMQNSKDASLCDEFEVLANVDFDNRPTKDLLSEEIQIENIGGLQAASEEQGSDNGKSSPGEQADHHLHEARHQRNKPTVTEADVPPAPSHSSQSPVPPLNLGPVLAGANHSGSLNGHPKVSLFTVEDNEKEEDAVTSEREPQKLEGDQKVMFVEFIPKKSKDSPSKSQKSAEDAGFSGEQGKKSFQKSANLRPQDKFGFCRTSYVLSQLEDGTHTKAKKRKSVGGTNKSDRGTANPDRAANSSQDTSQKTAKGQIKTNE